jgi:hypothetical protein
MSSTVQKPQSKKSGGPAPAAASSPESKSDKPLSNLPTEYGVLRNGKVLVVQDQNGRLVSVTRVPADSRYGVGVKPGPGHVMKEYEAEDLRDAVEPLKRGPTLPSSSKIDK